MASSPPPTNSPPSPTPPSPPTSSSSPSPQSSSSSPPPSSSSSPPPPTPQSSSPPPTSLPPPETSPPPPAASSPPPKTSPTAPPPNASSSPSPPSPQNSNSSSPPPPKESTSPAPPSNDNSKSPPPPPTPQSSNNAPPTPLQSSTTPPPSTKSLSPPPPSQRHSPPSSSSSNNSSSDSLPLIIGVAAGVGLLFILMLAISCWLCCRKKKKPQPDQMQFYNNPHRQSKVGEYYNGSPHPSNWHNNQNLNSPSGTPMGSLPSPPGAMGHAHGGGGWPSPPPPPSGRMMNNSGEMSSNYSPHHQYSPSMPPPHPAIVLGFNKSTFTYDELAAATGGFSQANLLGQGGFGYVHKGVLPNGKEVAVKSLKFGSGQGEREFQAEVEIISRVHHRHLVSLVGYCIAGGQRMLVYEFVPNNTLEYHLHGKGRPPMDWPTRLKIAMGAAKGLGYLHEDCHPRIIHRDIKTSNILLDYNFEAMVADFGLAKLSSDNYTHVSTRIMGTFGYLAPEYASTGKLTDKSDVFSYGVMLLELLTGRRPVDTTNESMEGSIADWARPILLRGLEDGNFDELVDPRLEKNYNPQESIRMAACASACIRHSARRRPKMSQIVRALEGDVSLEDLNEGVKPGQSTHLGSSGSDYENGAYSADMKKFRRMALASQEYGSSEFGATSEYGLNPSTSSSDSQEIVKNESRKHLYL